MELIPVIDLMRGGVVLGVAGRRESYAPIESRLVDSPEPLDVARAFRERLGLTRLYVADLDAIMSDEPQWAILERLAGDGFRLLVDAGLRETGAAERLVACGVREVVAGLETLPRPESLASLVSQVGPDRVVFSLDLQDGRPLGDVAGWGTEDAATIARRAIELGVTSLIVLDLSSVGTGCGVPTRDLCRRIRDEHPTVTLISGGGVRDRSDLIALQHAGVNAALVASALHDGRIGRDAIDAARSGGIADD